MKLLILFAFVAAITAARADPAQVIQREIEARWHEETNKAVACAVKVEVDAETLRDADQAQDELQDQSPE